MLEFAKGTTGRMTDHRTGEMGYVLVKFTQTRGGTELSLDLSRA
jgi:hypothetical protein